MRWTTREAAAGEKSQDQIRVLEDDSSRLIVLADGAGGMAGGALAAAMVVDVFCGSSVFDVASRLESLDARVAADPRAGETTAVVVAMMGDTLWGGSAGDSEAWLFHAHRPDEQELTRQQQRKRIGSGSARVQSFSTTAGDDSDYRLLVASDGLFKYASYAMIRQTARITDLNSAADALLEGVRLPSGRFRDDVSIFLGDWP